MRSLTLDEMSFVQGGATVEATVTGPGGTSVSVSVEGDPGGFGDALIDIYEGAVEATSYVIERVAKAL